MKHVVNVANHLDLVDQLKLDCESVTLATCSVSEEVSDVRILWIASLPVHDLNLFMQI